MFHVKQYKGAKKTMSFLTELNEQAEAVCWELIAAKRAAKAETGVKAAYHKGRAEELNKWLESLENMITKITERNAAEKYRDRHGLMAAKICNEREDAKK